MKNDSEWRRSTIFSILYIRKKKNKHIIIVRSIYLSLDSESNIFYTDIYIILYDSVNSRLKFTLTNNKNY